MVGIVTLVADSSRPCRACELFKVGANISGIHFACSLSPGTRMTHETMRCRDVGRLALGTRHLLHQLLSSLMVNLSSESNRHSPARQVYWHENSKKPVATCHPSRPQRCLRPRTDGYTRWTIARKPLGERRKRLQLPPGTCAEQRRRCSL